MLADEEADIDDAEHRASAIAAASGHFQMRRMTTNSRIVVISMSPVTEMP